MKNVEVDFNDLARGGKIRVPLRKAPDITIGERDMLIEDAEDMRLEATATEFDAGAAYFELAHNRAEGTIQGAASIHP